MFGELGDYFVSNSLVVLGGSLSFLGPGCLIYKTWPSCKALPGWLDMSGQHLSPLSNCNTRDLKIKLFSDAPAITLMQSLTWAQGPPGPHDSHFQSNGPPREHARERLYWGDGLLLFRSPLKVAFLVIKLETVTAESEENIRMHVRAHTSIYLYTYIEESNHIQLHSPDIPTVSMWVFFLTKSFFPSLTNWIVSLPNSYVEALTAYVIILEIRLWGGN